MDESLIRSDASTHSLDYTSSFIIVNSPFVYFDVTTAFGQHEYQFESVAADRIE